MKIQVGVGQEFTITLKTNPATGYQWPLAESLVGYRDLRAGGLRIWRPEAQFVGAVWEEAWIFRAIRKGETGVSMEYVCPWEKGISPAKTRAFTVVVG